MIELVHAKSGDPTVRFDGKFLASAYDPRGEGQKWAERYLARLSGVKSVLVLGAGAGYHLEALKMAMPHLQVICIEYRTEIKNAVKSRLGISLLGIQLLAVDQSKNAFKHELLRKALRAPYAVVRSSASSMLDFEFYDRLELDLNGRTQIGMQSICEIRGRAIPGQNSRMEYYSYLDFLEEHPQPNYEEFIASRIIKELVT